MNVRALKYAIALDEYRSFQHAARASNISPSALSRAIQALEDEFELQLFDRSSRDIAITPAGREFISAARMIVLYGDDLRTRMKFLKDATAGSVVFGLAPLPAGLLLSEFLAQMLREEPQINIHAKTGVAPDLLPQIDDGTIEFMICTDTALNDLHQYAVRELHRLDLFVMTRRDHPLARLGEIKQEDLESYPILGGAFPNNMWPTSQGYIPTHTICNNYDAIFAAVAATDACCLCPRIGSKIGNIDPDLFAFTAYSASVFSKDSSLLLVYSRQRPLSLAATLAVRQMQNVIADIRI